MKIVSCQKRVLLNSSYTMYIVCHFLLSHSYLNLIVQIVGRASPAECSSVLNLFVDNAEPPNSLSVSFRIHAAPFVIAGRVTVVASALHSGAS